MSSVTIPNKGFYMVSKEKCIYCDMVEELFDQADQEYTKVLLDYSSIQHLVPPKVKTYPFIFKDGTYYGGFKELNRELGF